MDGQDAEGPGLWREQGQDVRESVGPVNDRDDPALPHRLEQEAGPDLQPAVGDPGVPPLRIRRAQGALVIEIGRVGEGGVEGAEAQLREGRADVGRDDLDPPGQCVLRDIA